MSVKNTPPKEILGLIILFLFILTVYCSFPMRCRMHLGHGQDANENSWWLERDLYFRRLKDVFYPLLACGYYKIWKLFGWQKGGMYPLQILSSIFGAGGVIIFYFLIKTIFKDKKISLVGSIFFAFSYGYWFFSIESVNNILCLFFMLSAILLLFKVPEKDILRFPIYVALLHSIGIFMEVLGSLFVPALIFGFWVLSKDRREGYIRGLVYLFTLSFITIFTHWIIGYYYFEMSSFKDIFEALTSSSPVWTSNIYIRLWVSIRTLFHTLFAWANTQLISLWLYNMSDKVNAVFLVVYFIIFLYAVFYINRFSKYFNNIILFSLVWIAFPLPFYCYNEPGALEYYLYLLPVIWLIILIIFINIRHKINNIGLKRIFNCSALFFLPIFVIYNFCLGIYPRTKFENNEVYKQYLFLKQYVNNNDLLIILEGRGSAGLAICYLNNMLGSITEHIIYVECNETEEIFNKLITKKTKPDSPIYYEEFNLLSKEDVYYGPAFYQWLVDKSLNFNSIKIFITYINLKSVLEQQDKQLSVSSIISDIASLSNGLFTDNKLTQKFLDTLSNNYAFELISTAEADKLDCTLLSLSHR